MRGIQSSREAAALDASVLLETVDTPALIVDVSILESNIQTMQETISSRGVALRPHAKTHKSIAVARLQLEAGAQGLTVGTLGEAETFAAAGIRDLFLAYPLLVDGPKSKRLRSLLEVADLRVGIDSVDGARLLAGACDSGQRPRVIVEVDSGDHRSGSSPDAAGVVGRAAQDSGSEVIGVFTHGGHSYSTLGASVAAADDEVDALRRAMDSLQAAGIEPEVVSAGSTPTAALSARPPVTEERPGTYVFGDRQQVMLGACDRREVALFVAATVVSRDASRGTVTLNSGAKSLARDRKPWMSGHGELVGYSEASIEELYDYHAVVGVAEGAAPELGEQVLVMPNHACPVVNLFDELQVVRSGRVVDTWRVDARGRSA